jgi:hypothetical protein
MPDMSMMIGVPAIVMTGMNSPLSFRVTPSQAT